MIRAAIGIAAAFAATFGVLLWRQNQINRDLERELATRRSADVAVSVPATTPPALADAPGLSAESLQAIEDEILAVSEFAVPLTAEQRERVRLDTIIRKGELDGDYAMLFRQLRLPPDTLDALKTLLVERKQAIYDARKLSEEEGLVFASTAEKKAVANSALGEIDARIAALIGRDGYAKLREHVDLAFYRGLAEMMLSGSRSSTDPADDERVRELARRLHQVAPDYEEIVFQRNGWPGEEPPAVTEAIAAFLGDAPRPEIRGNPRSAAIHRRMAEIARDALLEGRISMNQLSGSVAPEYRAARERLEKAATQ